MSDQSTSNTKAGGNAGALKKGGSANAKMTAEQQPINSDSIEGELITESVDAPTEDMALNALDDSQDTEESVQVDASESSAEAMPASQKAVLALGGGADAGGVEIVGLHESQVSVLQEQHAKGLIEVQRKASELKVDIQALDQTLESLTSQARTANDAGVNITATHTQNTSLGQTEIIVGNTQRAAAGKVAPIWGGIESPQLRTGLMIGAAVLAGVLLSALFG